MKTSIGLACLDEQSFFKYIPMFDSHNLSVRNTEVEFSIHTHFTDENTETQKGGVTFP